MKIHDVRQGSSEWFQARAGVVTASEMDALISPTGKVRTGDGVRTYLHRKLAERVLNGPILTGAGFAADQGSMLEGEAIPLLRFEHEWPIERVGFITSDDGRIGCSPDGLIGDDCGCEIKCPELPTAIEYLLANEVPPKYYAQVQGSLLVTDRPRWRFVSYNRQLPLLVVEVERDEAFIGSLRLAIAAFLAEYDEAWARIGKLKGRELPNGPAQERRATDSQ